MKYKVKMTKAAEADILTSFQWGVRNWGLDQAKKWVTNIRRAIKQRLSLFPNGCPLAPDRDLQEDEVRHLIVGRYRVLFEVEGRLVRVLRVRGAYFDDEDL